MYGGAEPRDDSPATSSRVIKNLFVPIVEEILTDLKFYPPRHQSNRLIG